MPVEKTCFQLDLLLPPPPLPPTIAAAAAAYRLRAAAASAALTDTARVAAATAAVGIATEMAMTVYLCQGSGQQCVRGKKSQLHVEQGQAKPAYAAASNERFIRLHLPVKEEPVQHGQSRLL